MSDRFHQITMEQLTDWVFTELEEKDSIFGIPRSAFFVPAEDDRFRIEKYGQLLETPVRGGGRAPHPDGAEHHRVVARRCSLHRAQDDPDAG